jgi:hypothetical protein
MCNKRKYKDLISVMFALSQCKKVGKFNPIRNEKDIIIVKNVNAII